MTVAGFTYHRPVSLADACALGLRLGADAAYLAGGTELLPDFHRGRESASHLIALDRIPGLTGIRVDPDGLCIGALTTISAVASSPEIYAWLPALAEAARALGSPPIRSLATVGGNFCRAVPCADLPPVGIAAEALVRLTGVRGTREVSAEEFFLGPRKTVLEPGEVLREVVFRTQPAGAGTSFQRFARRRGSALAVASIAARVVMEGETIVEARIALGAVAPIPCLAPREAALLRGQSVSADRIAQAAVMAATEARPITDIRGTEAFRRELVTVLTRRALEEAARRARQRTQ
jgi:aerobic carbon-monoxide dehydrogenase medium subunit